MDTPFSPFKPDAAAGDETRDIEIPARCAFPFLKPARSAGELGWVGPYRILRILGRGGMGVVFLAEDTMLARQIALKVMRDDVSDSPNARQRFLREARAAAALRHENIVPVYQISEDAGVAFITMPYLEGVNLYAHVQTHGPLPIDQVREIGRQIAEGLAAAHNKGLIHRDIKPGNIWLEKASGAASSPHVRILDFGLARATESDADMTRTGAVVGTPGYMAPEQIRGETVDARADLFALGCVLYFMCAGQGPYSAGNFFVSMKQSCETPPAPLRERNRETPQWLIDLIDRLLAKQPSARPQSAAEVALVLARGGKLPAGATAPKVGSRRRIGWAVITGLLAALSVCAAIAYLHWPREDNVKKAAAKPNATVEQKRQRTDPGGQPNAVASTPAGRRVLIVLPAKNFYYSDFAPVAGMLVGNNIPVVIASSSAQPATPDPDHGGKPITPDILLSEVRIADYSAIYFCGGIGIDEYAGNGPHAAAARQLIQQALSSGKYVAALGCAPVILAEAGVLKNTPATCYKFGNPGGIYIERMKAAGSLWQDLPVVVADKIITGRGPADSQQFAKTLLKHVVE